MADEEDSIEDAKDLALAKAIQQAEERRYLFRKLNYRKGNTQFAADLVEEEDCSCSNSEEEHGNDSEVQQIEKEASKMPWLTEEEFIQKYRVSRSTVLEC